MTANIGLVERIARIVVGAALIAFAIPIGFPSTGWNWVGWIGVIPVLTGLFGVCPAYSLLGLSTCSVKAPARGPPPTGSPPERAHALAFAHADPTAKRDADWRSDAASCCLLAGRSVSPVLIMRSCGHCSSQPRRSAASMSRLRGAASAA